MKGQPKQLKEGQKVKLVDDPPISPPGTVLMVFRRHRGPAWYVVKWPSGASWGAGAEDHYERSDLLLVE